MFFGGDAEQRFHFLAVGYAAFADALIVFADDFRGALHLRGLAFDFEVVTVPQMRGDAAGPIQEVSGFRRECQKTR